MVPQVSHEAYVAMKTHIVQEIEKGRTRVTIAPCDYFGCDAHDVRRALAEIADAGYQWPSRR